MEEELKKDHSDMQAVVDSKQKIIDAQVTLSSDVQCEGRVQCCINPNDWKENNKEFK